MNFSVHAVGDPSAGIQQAWITYTGVDPGKWESLMLSQNASDSTLWTGSLTLPGFSTAQIDAIQFVAQAVDGVGLVSLDDNQGSYYQPNAIPPALTNASLALDLPGVRRAELRRPVRVGGQPERDPADRWRAPVARAAPP